MSHRTHRSFAAALISVSFCLSPLFACAQAPSAEAKPAEEPSPAKPMMKKEPMTGEMKKDGMMKEDVSKAARQWDEKMKEMMEKEKGKKKN